MASSPCPMPLQLFIILALLLLLGAWDGGVSALDTGEDVRTSAPPPLIKNTLLNPKSFRIKKFIQNSNFSKSYILDHSDTEKGLIFDFRLFSKCPLNYFLRRGVGNALQTYPQINFFYFFY